MPIEHLGSLEAAPALSQKKTFVREDAEERIENFMGHSFEMLGQMMNQQENWLKN